MSSSAAEPQQTAAGARIGRMLQCVGGRQSFAGAPREAAPEDAGLCFLVFCAGSSNFNGMYKVAPQNRHLFTFKARPLSEALAFRKVDSSETLLFHSDWWLFNVGGSGVSYYGAKVGSAGLAETPPEGGWQVKHGQRPAPRLQCFQAAQVPRQLRDPGMLERSVLTVSGAGSAELNGTYPPCSFRHGKLCYRKEGGVQMLVHHEGWWLLCRNGQGESFYGFRAPEVDHVAPPDHAVWSPIAGEDPAPRVQSRAAPTEPPSKAGERGADCALDTPATSFGSLAQDKMPTLAGASDLQPTRDCAACATAAVHRVEGLNTELIGQAGIDSVQQEVHAESERECPPVTGVVREEALAEQPEHADAHGRLRPDSGFGVPRRASEVASASDSAGLPHLCFSAARESDISSIGQTGRAGEHHKEVHAEEDERALPLPIAASSGQLHAPAEPAESQGGGVQSTMPTSWQVTDQQMLLRGSGGLSSEAVDTFRTGLVAQRVSTFTNQRLRNEQQPAPTLTKLSNSMSQSFSGLAAAQRICSGAAPPRENASIVDETISSLEEVRDQGIVSERIRAHQRLISGATPRVQEETDRLHG